MPVKTYDPKQVVITFGGVPLFGFADGTFVVVERLNDDWTDTAGSDGEVARSKSNDDRGTMTLTLMQTSLSNDVLSGIYVLDKKTNQGALPAIVKDLSGTTTLFTGTAWITKIPNMERAKEIGNVEWVIRLATMEIFLGGIAI